MRPPQGASGLQRLTAPPGGDGFQRHRRRPAHRGHLPTYFWQSLLCFFLFLPTAVVALIYAFQVGRRVQMGDQAGAVRASRLARTWCLLSLAVFTVATVVWLTTGTII